MLTKDSKIAVVGAGAIGGVTAEFIHQLGWDTEIICKHQETVDKIAAQGLHISGVKGEQRVRLKAVKNISDLSEPKDLVLLATNANDCLSAARQLNAFLKPDSTVVSLQNGICEEALAETLGRERIVGCVVGWGATYHAPAELEVTSEGEFIIGNIDHRPDERLPAIQRLLNIERGRKTEINFLNGYICERGKEHGVPKPINDAIRNMVLEIEDGKREMSLNNVKDSVFGGI